MNPGFAFPKEDMVKKIAAALNVAECALLEPDTGNLEGIMETLFWLDEDMPDVLRCSLTMPFDKIQAEADSNIVPIIAYKRKNLSVQRAAHNALV